MDEYLSEKEQIDRIKSWWSDNGWYLLGGIVIGLGGLYGYGQYENYTNRRAEEAAALYFQVQDAVSEDDLAAVDRVLGQLQDEYSGSPYTDHARLLLARLVLVRDSDRAARELRTVMETSDDPDLAMIARLRLARVLAYREEYDQALATLAVDEPGQFGGRISEIRGDIYFAQGNADAARAAYSNALVADGAELLDRNLLQMKLDEIISTLNAPLSQENGG